MLNEIAGGVLRAFEVLFPAGIAGSLFVGGVRWGAEMSSRWRAAAFALGFAAFVALGVASGSARPYKQFTFTVLFVGVPPLLGVANAKPKKS